MFFVAENEVSDSALHRCGALGITVAARWYMVFSSQRHDHDYDVIGTAASSASDTIYLNQPTPGTQESVCLIARGPRPSLLYFWVVFREVKRCYL